MPEAVSGWQIRTSGLSLLLLPGPLNISLCENTLFDTDLIVYEGLRHQTVSAMVMDQTAVRFNRDPQPSRRWGTRYLIRVGIQSGGAGQLFITTLTSSGRLHSAG